MDSIVELIELAAQYADLDSVEFNSALAEIQNHLGQSTGDFAGMWFSGRQEKWESGDSLDRKEMLVAYIKDELANLTEEY